MTARRVLLTVGLVTSATAAACLGWVVNEVTRPIQLAGRWTERWADR